jgi:hypothetical protein
VRVEIHVRREDAPLVRGVVSALSDPAREAEARMLLRQRFAAPPMTDLKALRAAAPLEGIDLDRDTALGREIELLVQRFHGTAASSPSVQCPS